MVRWSISKKFGESANRDILDIKCDILKRLHIRKLIYNEVDKINYNGGDYNEVRETLLKEMEGGEAV